MKKSRKETLYNQIKKASNIIETADEITTNNLVKYQHASKEFKEYQRISNAILNTKRAIDKLIYELHTQ